jgi:glucose-1-phosphate adenylyltransferase
MKNSVPDRQMDPRHAAEANERAKSLLGIGEGGRPFLDYLLFNARSAGYDDIVIVINDRDAAFRNYFGPADRGNPFHGLFISYAVQHIPAGRTKPLGTADALLQALYLRRDWSGSGFTVCNSDNLYSIRALGAMRELGNACGLVDYAYDGLGCGPDRVRQYAVLQKEDEGNLTNIIEKPDASAIAAATDGKGRIGISMNLYRFSYDMILPVLEILPLHPARQEKELPEAVRRLVSSGHHTVRTIPLSEVVPDLTSKSDITTVQDYLQKVFGSGLWEQELKPGAHHQTRQPPSSGT